METKDGVLYEPLPEFVVQVGEIVTRATRIQPGGSVSHFETTTEWSFHGAYFDQTQACLRAEDAAESHPLVRVVTREVAGI